MSTVRKRLERRSSWSGVVRNVGVTLRDVARASGVSHQTVSRVINAHPSVAPHTRERVLSAISKLGYRRNSAARQLATGKSNTVGIVSYGVTHYGPAQMLSSVEQALREAGFGLVLASLADLTLGGLEHAITYLQEQSVDGVVIIVPLDVDVARVRALCRATPFVLVDVPAKGDVPAVAIHQRLGAELATRHLLALGHSAIAELRGPHHWFDAQQRHEGFLETLAQAGLEPAAAAAGDWSAESGYEGTREMLRSRLNFSALFAANDQMALGALAALREAGLAVPGDVSVVGFDDIPEAAYFHPTLTTVRQDIAALGRHSVAYLLALLRGEPVPDTTLLEPVLIERESSAAR